MSLVTLAAYDEKHKAGEGSRSDEKMLIYSLIRQFNPTTVCEIGVSKGHMTAWIALALKANNNQGKCVSVDNWSRNSGGAANSSAHAQGRLIDNDLDKQVTFITEDSKEFLAACPDNSFDFVWVDGDHDEDNAFIDIKEAYRVAKMFVGVHDTAQQYTGPKKACKKFEKKIKKKGFWVKGNRGIWLINKGNK